MSAANASAPSPSVEEEMRAHEPSMEEILASIRRIIADDDSLPGARRDERRRREPEAPAIEPPTSSAAQNAYPAPALEPAVVARAPEMKPEPRREPEPLPPVADIRLLRPTRAASEPVAPAYEPEDEYEDDDLETAPLSASLETLPQEEPESFEPVESGPPLVSADAASSIATHFQALAASMVINDSGLLQKYAQEMLRPMLKQWLDDNLPVIVERLVRAEIERVARGGRR